MQLENSFMCKCRDAFVHMISYQRSSPITVLQILFFADNISMQGRMLVHHRHLSVQRSSLRYGLCSACKRRLPQVYYRAKTWCYCSDCFAHFQQEYFFSSIAETTRHHTTIRKPKQHICFSCKILSIFILKQPLCKLNWKPPDYIAKLRGETWPLIPVILNQVQFNYLVCPSSSALAADCTSHMKTPGALQTHCCNVKLHSRREHAI